MKDEKEYSKLVERKNENKKWGNRKRRRMRRRYGGSKGEEPFSCEQIMSSKSMPPLWIFRTNFLFFLSLSLPTHMMLVVDRQVSKKNYERLWVKRKTTHQDKVNIIYKHILIFRILPAPLFTHVFNCLSLSLFLLVTFFQTACNYRHFYSHLHHSIQSTLVLLFHVVSFTAVYIQLRSFAVEPLISINNNHNNFILIQLWKGKERSEAYGRKDRYNTWKPMSLSCRIPKRPSNQTVTPSNYESWCWRREEKKISTLERTQKSNFEKEGEREKEKVSLNDYAVCVCVCV